MSNWGLRPEFREQELRKAVDIVAQRLMRDLQHGLCDPDLSNFLTKSTRALVRQASRSRSISRRNHGAGKTKTKQA